LFNDKFADYPPNLKGVLELPTLSIHPKDHLVKKVRSHL